MEKNINDYTWEEFLEISGVGKYLDEYKKVLDFGNSHPHRGFYCSEMKDLTTTLQQTITDTVAFLNKVKPELTGDRLELIENFLTNVGPVKESVDTMLRTMTLREKLTGYGSDL